MQAPYDAVGFCVAPTYWHTQKQWREFFTYCPAELVVDINRSDKHVTLENDKHVWFKSADNPDSLRSEGIDVLWVDEGGQIKEDAWTLGLRPALLDRKGKGIFTGTPKGKNWYFQLWTRGQDPQQTDYKSWTFPSQNNPYLDPKEIAEFARDMPEMAYKQEILAQFIEDIGSVFRGVEKCVKGTLEAPIPNKAYVAGADLAKLQDFTVVCVLDNAGRLVAFDRFGELDWVFQRKRIVNLCQRYNARLLIDSTGVGEPFYDSIKRDNVHVDGYKFTNASKKELVENLSIRIENQTVSFPEIPELINELKLFGYKMMPSGLIQYGAPEGYHDDCVIALALATWQVSRPKGFWV